MPRDVVVLVLAQNDREEVLGVVVAALMVELDGFIEGVLRLVDAAGVTSGEQQS
jgi:hypothetical protein